MSTRYGRCTCEALSRSLFGVVLDGETVSRVVANPRHFKKDGKTIKPSLFGQTDVERRGLSLLRRDHMDSEEFLLICVSIAEVMSKDELAGIVSCDVASLRELQDLNGLRGVCVFDDPVPATDKLPEISAHCIAVAAMELSREDLVRIRTELSERFGELERLASAA